MIQELTDFAGSIWSKNGITTEEFIQACQLGIKILEQDWDSHRTIGDVIVGFRLFPVVFNNPALDNIATQFIVLQQKDKKFIKSDTDKLNVIASLKSAVQLV